MNVDPAGSGTLAALAPVIEQLPECAVLLAMDSSIAYVNSMFEHWTGYQRDEVLGRNCTQIDCGLNDPAFLDAMASCLAHGGTFRGVFENRNRAGDAYHAETTISPVGDETGTTCFYLVLSRNSLDMAYAGPALDFIIKDTPLGMYVLQEGRFRYLNARFLEQSGFSLGELRDQPWYSLVAPEDREAVDKASKEMLRGERQAPFEYRSFGRYGEARWYLGTVARTDFDGRAGVVGTRIDITERKLAEQRLVEANSLHAATIEAAGDGILVIQDERAVSFNRQFTKMWNLPESLRPGVPEDEVMGYVSALLRSADEFVSRVKAARSQPDSDIVDMVELVDGRVFEVHSRTQWIEGRAAGRAWSFHDLSRLSFSDESTVFYMREQFERLSLTMEELVVELTETTALKDLGRTARMIMTLKELGCRVALDDFGAGFSSFQELRSLPLDLLKIDGSFIRDITRSARDVEIVRSIVHLAGALGMETVAEEVVDAPTLALLGEIGVDMAQGYYIGRPRPASRLIEQPASRRPAA